MNVASVSNESGCLYKWPSKLRRFWEYNWEGEMTLRELKANSARYWFEQGKEDGLITL